MDEQILTCVYFGMAGAGCVGKELRVRAIAITGFCADAILRVAAAVLDSPLSCLCMRSIHAGKLSQVGDSVTGRPETAATWSQVQKITLMLFIIDLRIAFVCGLLPTNHPCNCKVSFVWLTISLSKDPTNSGSNIRNCFLRSKVARISFICILLPSCSLVSCS